MEEKITIAYFTAQEIALLHSNLDELNQAGKIGNAHSIAMLLDAGIKRGFDRPKTTTDEHKDTL